MRYFFYIIVAFLIFGCENNNSIFKKLDADDTNIHFINKIEETEKDNVLSYEYFYNGGGVAAADFNNDGLVDLYFTANQGSDKLYINKGKLEFEDITEKAGISWNGEWKTGVTVVDINNDGWQDIYVSVSGNIDNPNLRKNKLYINNGKSSSQSGEGSGERLTFTDKAAEYGLDLHTYTTQTAFFDFDKDNDLDAYVLNHNVKDFKRFDVAAIRFMRDSLAGHRLLENVDGKFTDISEKAGIKGNPIGFGLGINITDLNNDGWQDIYVSNDYLEEDYLYINQQNGTFKDEIKAKTNHISYFSMGNDIGDINNDLLPDILTSDMLPEDNKRQKLLFGPDKYDAYLNMLRNDIHPSFMRNMLQINNGDGTFSEIGQVAGLSNTDWTWSILAADFDNDGFKDVMMTNGYLRDYTNMDFMKYYADEGSQEGVSILDVVKKMPSTQVANYIFRNEQNLTFSNKQKEWGFDKAVISNGAVYADLDNDGDLEIITNNINEEASVFKNLSTEQKAGNYLNIQLESEKKYGTKCYVFAGQTSQYQEFTPTHGYQSSIMGPLHFGLGSSEKIDSLVIVWNDGKVQKQTNIQANQLLKIKYAPNATSFIVPIQKTLFTETNSLDFTHGQIPLNDFSRQILLPQMYSYQGPRMAKGDVNKDGLEDIFIGGGKGQAGELFIQQSGGSFAKSSQTTFKQDELCTDTDAVFFDVEGDGDLDLYVTSGGYEYLPNDLVLQNRLYLNDGKGNFTKTFDAFDDTPYADCAVETIDFDRDGDLDLFVAGSVVPLNYPIHNPSRLYRNDKGKFTKVENPIFNDLGILTDVIAIDYDKDGWQDLIAVGEWTGIICLKNNKGNLEKFNDNLSQIKGLWQRIYADDFDKDGDLDVVVGNYGLNSQLKATDKEPMSMVYEDFDDNGRLDPILSYYIQGKNYPFYSRDELSEQLVALKKKYTSHELYSNATTEEVLTVFPTKQPKKLEANTLETIYLENKNGGFEVKKLPIQAQFSPVFAITSTDINKDGFADLVLGGNQSHGRIRIGNIDANYGQIFLNDGKGGFRFYSNLGVRGDVKDLKVIGNQLFVGVNSNKTRVFRLN
ncbi:MAG: VCBS repeat-containing protein [Spirosomataceae bacterium]